MSAPNPCAHTQQHHDFIEEYIRTNTQQISAGIAPGSRSACARLRGLCLEPPQQPLAGDVALTRPFSQKLVSSLVSQGIVYLVCGYSSQRCVQYLRADDKGRTRERFEHACALTSRIEDEKVWWEDLGIGLSTISHVARPLMSAVALPADSSLLSQAHGARSVKRRRAVSSFLKR